MNRSLALTIRIWKIVGSAVVVLTLAAAVLILQSFFVMRSARGFIEHLRSLTSGTSRLVDAQAVLNYPEVTKVCSAQDCSFQFQFETWASRLHLFRPSAVFGEVQTKNGTVELINILYGQGQSTFVRISEMRCASCASKDRVNLHAVSQDDTGKWSLGFNDVPPVVREQLLSINVGCLTKVSGCQNRNQILPASWLKS